MKEAIKIIEAQLKPLRAKRLNSKYLPPTQKSLVKEAELKAQVLILQKSLELLKRAENT